MVVLLGARELQRIAETQVEGEALLHLPVGLQVGGGGVPLVVVGDEHVAQCRLVVDAEQELRELHASIAGGGAAAVGERAVAVELVAAAGGAEHRDGLEPLLQEVEPELPGLVAPHPGGVVGDVVGVLRVLALLALAPADAATPGDELGQAPRREARQPQLRREVPPALRVEAGREVAREAAVGVVEAQVVDHRAPEGLGVGQQHLPRPAVVGAARVDLVPAHLEVAAAAVAPDRHLRVAQRDVVPRREVMVQPDGQALFQVLDERRRRVVAQAAVAVQEVLAGQRQVLQEALAHGVEHLRRNAVARESGEGLARGQCPPAELLADQLPLVVEDDRLPGQAEALGDVAGRVAAADGDDVAEVAVAHGLGGEQRVRRGRRIVVVARLVGDVEEAPVAAVIAAEELSRDLDRPPEGEGALVLPAVRGRPVDGGGGEGRGVEGRVAVIPGGQTAVFVGTGLGRHVDDAAGGLAVLRREVGGLDGELLHGVGRERDHRAPQTHTGIPRAVGQDRGGARAAAVDEEVHARRRNRGAQVGVLRARGAAHVGHGEGEVEHAPVVQRRLHDLPLGDGLAVRPRFGVDERPLRGDRHLGGESAHFEGHVHGHRGGGVDLHPRHHRPAEPGHLHLDPVRHGIELGDGVAATGGGRGLEPFAGPEVGDGHRRAGQHAPAVVRYGPGDAAAVGLGGGDGGERRYDQDGSDSAGGHRRLRSCGEDVL